MGSHDFQKSESEYASNRRRKGQGLAHGHVSTATRGKLQLKSGEKRFGASDGLGRQGHELDIVPMTIGLGAVGAAYDTFVVQASELGRVHPQQLLKHLLCVFTQQGSCAGGHAGYGREV